MQFGGEGSAQVPRPSCSKVLKVLTDQQEVVWPAGSEPEGSRRDPACQLPCHRKTLAVTLEGALGPGHHACLMLRTQGWALKV